MGRRDLINFHALSKSTGVRERQDVRVVLEAESLAVKGVLVMLKSCRANFHILAFSEEPVLQIQNLAVPKLIWIVDESDIAGIVVKLENLENFNKEVKIPVSSIFFPGANLWDILQFLNIALRKDVLLLEALGDPVSEACDRFLLWSLKWELFAEVGKRLEFTRISGTFDKVSFGLIQRSSNGGRYLVIIFLEAIFCCQRREKSPAWVEKDVAGELLHILVGLNVSSVDTDNFTYALDNWEIFELASKHHQCAMFNNSILIYLLVWIGNLHSADEAIRLKGFMGETSI